MACDARTSQYYTNMLRTPVNTRQLNEAAPQAAARLPSSSKNEIPCKYSTKRAALDPMWLLAAATPNSLPHSECYNCLLAPGWPCHMSLDNQNAASVAMPTIQGDIASPNNTPDLRPAAMYMTVTTIAKPLTTSAIYALRIETPPRLMIHPISNPVLPYASCTAHTARTIPITCPPIYITALDKDIRRRKYAANVILGLT